MPTEGAAADGGLRRESVVSRVTSQILGLIASGELGPGQQVRQEALAERLGVSRIPVREALKSLQSLGVVNHTLNVGYFVVRLTLADQQQIFLMRQLLETEVLRRLDRCPPDEAKALRDLNAQIEQAGKDADIARMHDLDTEFHFRLFGLSGLELVVDELRRLWTLTHSYRAVRLVDRALRTQLVKEHRSMITALRAGDQDRLVTLMDGHRADPVPG